MGIHIVFPGINFMGVLILLGTLSQARSILLQIAMDVVLSHKCDGHGENWCRDN